MAWRLPQFEEAKHPRGHGGTFTFKAAHAKITKDKKRKKRMKAIASPAKKRFNSQNPFKGGFSKTGPY
jgi:hypothetical protein